MKIGERLNGILSNKKILVGLIVIAVIILELFVFNYKFFQGLGYEPVPLTNVTLENGVSFTGNSVVKFANNGGKFIFDNVNTEIKNVYIDMESTRTYPEELSDYDLKDIEEYKLVKVKITADDDSNSAGIVMPERSVVSTVERTKYIPLYLKGETNKLVLEFNKVENREYKINNVILNKGVPFHFSIVRVLAILLLLGLIYVIRPKSKFYEVGLNFKNIKQRWVIMGVVLIQIIVMMTATHINPFYVHNTVSWQNQYNELATSILEGHLALSDIPDSRLETLENPYDITQRDSAGVNVKWDHAYYEGKYYVYFGIVPCLLFNIPAQALFNIELSPISCILILIPFFVIMSYVLIYCLAKKFKSKEGKNIPLLLYLMLSTLFVFGIGTAFLMVWPDMYTLPIFTAIVLAISGMYLWISAFREKEDGDYSLSCVRLGFGSLLMALIAGCRPQMILVLFVALPLFWNAVFKERKLFSKGSIRETACFVLPVAVFALFMLYYNYVRFGSVFEFGAQYNLTTNDVTARGINLARIPQGIFGYLLQPLNVEAVFPYINEVSGATQYMGITIREGTYGGFLFLQPIIILILLIPKVKEVLKKHKVYGIALSYVIFGMLIVIANSLMGGILSRYFIDFAYLFMLATFIVIFALYEKYEGRDYFRLFKKIMPIYFVFSMIVTFLLTIGARYYSPAETNPEVFWNIATLIQFWM